MVTTKPLALTVGVLAALSAGGYAFSLERLYRPIAGGPASHPLTVTTALLLVLALVEGWRSRRRRRATLAAMAALSICALRLLPGETAATLFGFLTPFQAVVAHDRDMGLSNGMGVNTALMFLSVSLAVLFYCRRWMRLSQVAAFISLAFPMVSITGYAYGLPRFYGQMSMMTIVFGMPLGLAAASLSANRALLKAILSPHIAGQVVRVQIVLGYLFPFLSGFLVVKAIHENGETGLFGIFVITISWFIILLVTICSVIHERIDHARRMHERTLIRTATQDPLTGLFNRRKFDLCLEAELMRSHRDAAPLSLIMIDVDHFKRVNDTGGHPMGDVVLKSIATAVKRHIRATDISGRLGGEEFAVLLPGTDLAGAAYLAESLRRIVESLHFPPWPGHEGLITASFGGATLKTEESASDLLRRADEALYAAKTGGRNRVCVSDRHDAVLVS